MLKGMSNFLRATGIMLVLLGIALSTQMLVADGGPGGGGVTIDCKGGTCNINCDSIQSSSGICHTLSCRTTPAADCGACTCGETALGGMFYCLCRK